MLATKLLRIIESIISTVSPPELAVAGVVPERLPRTQGAHLRQREVSGETARHIAPVWHQLHTDMRPLWGTFRCV